MIANTKIYYKLYQLLKLVYGLIKNFPKEHKYVLGTDIINLSWQCLDLSVAANAAPNSRKAGLIAELEAAFVKLQLRFRIGQEIRLLSAGQYSDLEEKYLLEIGKMISGWKKWAGRENLGVSN